MTDNIVIFGTPTCPNCDNVKSYLDSNGINYSYNQIGSDVTHEQVNEIVGRAVRSVPVVVVDGIEKTVNEIREMVARATMVEGLEL